MKKIPLSKTGKYKGQYFALVDDEDYERLVKYSWNVVGAKQSHLYAEHRLPDGKNIRLHRLIMNNPKGFIVDHINMNGLDNRRSNLRVCNKSENMRNRNKTRANKSGFKGVYWDTDTKSWKAQIKVGDKNYNLGRYHIIEKAALAYNNAAKTYFGSFARLNEIN